MLLDSQSQPAPASKALLFPAPPGLGKTHAVIEALAHTGTRCIYAAPTHALCDEVVTRCQMRGITTHYWRPGPTEDDECPHLLLVLFYRENGYIIRHGPCRQCGKKSTCGYRKVFTCSANRKAQVLVLTTWHLRRSDFWNLKAAESRPLLVLDEDACEALAAPAELSFQALARFVSCLQSLRNLCGDLFSDENKSEEDAWIIRRLMPSVDGDEAQLALTDILRRTCMELMSLCSTAVDGRWHEHLTFHDSLRPYDRELLSSHKAFEGLLALAYAVIMDKVELPNIFEPLRRIALKASPIYASKPCVQWPEVATIPADRRVLMLDATAESQVVEGVLQRQVEVLSIPRVKQKGTVYQIMDHLFTRRGTRQDVKSDDNFIRTFIREVCHKHKNGKLLVITFMEHEERLREYLEAIHSDVSVCHYGALRGLDAYGEHDVGIIIGRPMPNEARLALLAVSAFGMDVLSNRKHAPDLAWRIRQHLLGKTLWRTRSQMYDDPKWQAIWRHVVTGELLQAIGRLRPLSNDATVYILSSEPLQPIFEIEGVYGAELFPKMCLFGWRKDFIKRVKKYAQVMEKLIRDGGQNSNAEVCRHLSIKEPNGLRYRELAEKLLSLKMPLHPLFADANLLKEKHLRE